jgi:hypothetical protein
MLTLALIAMLVFSSVASAESVNVLMNGSLEEEFIMGVGQYWGTFDNGGYASYGYHDDTWERVLKDGAHSQLLELHTKAVGGSQKDRYMGIYQTVNVVPEKRYMLSFYGMVRSTEGSEKKSSYNYRLQVGYDYDGGTDWQAVTEWRQLDWPEYERLSPGKMQSYAYGVTPTGDKLTVFIRLWKKFPTVGQEANINLDAISLVGPAPATTQAASTSAQPAVEAAKPLLPQTGAALALPIAGIGLLALTLTGRRVLRRRL